MNQKTSTPHERIGRLGEQIIAIIEDEDPVVVLSALALLAASTCGAIAGDNPAAMSAVGEGFVSTFRDIITGAGAKAVMIH